MDNDTHKITKVPKRSDMVIWYSTLKGNFSFNIYNRKRKLKTMIIDYVSWRLADEGSIFIQSLITVFARTAWYYDLVTIVQCVREMNLLILNSSTFTNRLTEQ